MAKYILMSLGTFVISIFLAICLLIFKPGFDQIEMLYQTLIQHGISFGIMTIVFGIGLVIIYFIEYIILMKLIESEYSE